MLDNATADIYDQSRIDKLVNLKASANSFLYKLLEDRIDETSQAILYEVFNRSSWRMKSFPICQFMKEHGRMKPAKFGTSEWPKWAHTNFVIRLYCKLEPQDAAAAYRKCVIGKPFLYGAFASYCHYLPKCVAKTLRQQRLPSKALDLVQKEIKLDHEPELASALAFNRMHFKS
jgi:hypothetical protein